MTPKQILLFIKNTIFWLCDIWVKTWKTLEKSDFWYVFIQNLHVYMMSKIQNDVYFKGKNHWKKHKIFENMHDFQITLNHSKWVQITFWVVEKIASEILNPNPETQKIHFTIFENIENFHVRCHFFTIFKTLKNQFFNDIRWRRGRTTDLTRGKKTCDRDNFSPKISRKSKQNSKKYPLLKW